jgi:ABC-type multidrug transport system permease subunit
MSFALRLFARDLVEFVNDRRSILLVVVLPLVILAIAGRLELRPAAYQILIAGVPPCAKSSNAELPACKSERMLSQLSTFQVTSQEDFELSPLRRISEQGFDAILNFDSDGEVPELIVGSTEPFSVRLLLSSMFSISQSLEVIDLGDNLLQADGQIELLEVELQPLLREKLDTTVESITSVEQQWMLFTEYGVLVPERLPLAFALAQMNFQDEYANQLASSRLEGLRQDLWSVTHQKTMEAKKRRETWRTRIEAEDRNKTSPEVKDLYQQIEAVGTSQSLGFLLFPQVANRAISHLPMTVAMIVTFIPFILSVPIFFREREAHTLEALLTSPRFNEFQLLAGKCLAPMAITLFDFLCMIVLCESIYHLYAKDNLVEIVSVVSLASLSSVLFGVSISSMIKSQAQALMVLAAYFLALALFTGFFFPVEQSPAFIQWLSKLFALTRLRPALNAWMLGDGRVPHLWVLLGWLTLLAAFYGALAITQFRRMLRSI